MSRERNKGGVRHYPVKGYVGYDWNGEDTTATRQVLRAADRKWEDEYEDGPELTAPRRAKRTRRKPTADRRRKWSERHRDWVKSFASKGYDGSDPFPYSNPKVRR